MPRFYFDVRYGASLVADETGFELSGLNEAQEEATRTLGELARESLPRMAAPGVLAVHVSDAAHRPLIEVSLTYEVRKVVGD